MQQPEMVTLSDGSTRKVGFIPFAKYDWVFKRLGGIMTKQDLRPSSPEDAVIQAVDRLLPDMVQHSGTSLEGLGGDDRELVVAAIRRVNQVNDLFNPLCFGAVAMAAKAYLMSLKKALVLNI